MQITHSCLDTHMRVYTWVSTTQKQDGTYRSHNPPSTGLSPPTLPSRNIKHCDHFIRGSAVPASETHRMVTPRDTSPPVTFVRVSAYLPATAGHALSLCGTVGILFHQYRAAWYRDLLADWRGGRVGCVQFGLLHHRHTKLFIATVSD